MFLFYFKKNHDFFVFEILRIFLTFRIFEDFGIFLDFRIFLDFGIFWFFFVAFFEIFLIIFKVTKVTTKLYNGFY